MNFGFALLSARNSTECSTRSRDDSHSDRLSRSSNPEAMAWGMVSPRRDTVIYRICQAA